MTQKKKQPNKETTYTIEFYTNNPIPQDGAINIVAPKSVKLIPDETQCYVILDSGTMKNVCKFGEDRTIKIENAFNTDRSKETLEYKGRVRIFFRAITPAENKYRESFTLAIFESKNYAYKIDEIDDGLFTTFTCGYPC